MSDLELIKSLFVFTCLVYASYSDIKTGEISNKVWCVMGLAGALFVIVDFVFVALLCSVGIMSIVMFAFYYFKWFAGADVKAMLCLSILYPHFIAAPLLPLLPTLHFSFPLLPFPTVALNILFFSLLSGTLYSVLCKKKSGMAFLPHIAIGWIIVLISENFI